MLQIVKKLLIAEKFRIENDLVIILHLGFKFHVRKSKNIEAAYIPQKTTKIWSKSYDKNDYFPTNFGLKVIYS